MQKNHRLKPETIKRIKVFTFHEAVRLTCRHPQTTEEAQYSLPFPLAAVLVYGRLGTPELSHAALKDLNVLRLSECVEMIEDEKFNARFPAQRFARVEIETNQSEIYDSGEVEPKWDAAAPPTDDELREKFRWLARERLPDSRSAELEQMIWHCAALSDAAEVQRLLK